MFIYNFCKSLDNGIYDEKNKNRRKRFLHREI